MGKKISENCLKLVKEFEGCRLKAYKDEVGVWTIGYGITNSDKKITGITIKKGLTITKEAAGKWLEEALNQKYLPLVLKFDNIYDWNQNELDALTSFAYNIGSISQLTADGTRSKSVIADKMLLYSKAGGTVYRGLIRRRTAERDLFLTAVKTASTQEIDCTKERKAGVKYFDPIKNKSISEFSEFLHKRNLGAGKPNLSKIASANAESEEVQTALLKLAKKGLLIKPDGLNAWKK